MVLTGELDLASEREFSHRLELLSGDGVTLVLDLSGVSFIDSRGVQALVHAAQEARAASRRICLAPDVSPQVKRLFEITNTGSHLDLAPVL